MTGPELQRELTRRRLSRVYHACTLGTFRSYCKLGAYQSRAAVEAANLPLTPQFSDDADRKRSVLNHLFLNAYDQHGDVHRGLSVFGLNKYGPVLMVFETDFLANVEGLIWSYRHEIADAGYEEGEHRIETLRDFIDETFRFTAPHAYTGEPSRRPGTRGPASCFCFAQESNGIAFEPHLVGVIVDDLPDRFEPFRTDSFNAIQQLVAGISPAAQVRRRQCIERCGCRPSYERLSLDQVREFFLTTNQTVSAMNLPRHT